MKIFVFILALVLFFSCEPSASEIISQAEVMVDEGDYYEAKEKLYEVINESDDRDIVTEAEELIERIEEIEAYNNAETTNSIYAWENFLENFPNHSKVNEIHEQLEELYYEEASSAALSSKWKSFLEKYPNHSEKDNIEEKIIYLEIEEILADAKTGKLPSFDKSSGYSSSGNSSVSISNDTGYDLELRYRGPETKMVTIPEGRTRSISLQNGNYTITASAGGLNYAGSETLSGSYTSSYYITTSSY